MALPRVKSHANLRDRSKQYPQGNNKQCRHGDDNHHIEPVKSNNIVTAPGKPDTDKAHAHSVSLLSLSLYRNKCTHCPLSIESDNPIHHHGTVPAQEGAISSSTKPVVTTELVDTGDTTKSELHNVGSLFSEFDPGTLPSPLSPPNPASDDYDPSDSLLMQASLYIPSSDDDASATPSQSDSAVERSKSNRSSLSWHDWFVTLFAGRKATPATRKHQNKTTTSAGSLVAGQPTLQPPKTDPIPVSTQVPPNTQQRRLLHCDVIPRIHVPKMDRTFRRTTLKEIPPAPMTDFTGYTVIAPDDWEPEIVMRGFDTPKRISKPLLAPNYINYAARLLDRDGDKWARYRTEHLMTRSNRAFSGDIGEQYPFSHGHCW
ncbi:uncharacterized protein yc1106_02592 [Curvularia clavata]|uniref:Uncharacterized protein n=1 Tax=Curvularia clavata TaxID=95742 RepID=A0A9Q8Z7J5_CURCL|nr:uncharacterized protein yc1106_02592 [Curvularia clavata]